MQDQLSLLLACRDKFCVCCSNLMYCTWSSPNFLNRKYCCNICTKNLICGWCFFSYSMLYQKMYVKDNFFMSRNFCFSFVLEYDNVLYANEVETKKKQKLLNIKNELQHMYMRRTYRKIWSLQSTGIFRCLINLDVRLTRVGASQKMIPRERLMHQNREGPALPACLPLLHVPLSPTLKKYLLCRLENVHIGQINNISN